jgi:hypothetical protein
MITQVFVDFVNGTMTINGDDFDFQGETPEVNLEGISGPLSVTTYNDTMIEVDLTVIPGGFPAGLPDGNYLLTVINGNDEFDEWNLTIHAGEIADGSVTEANLAFETATQAEIDAHKASDDHDGRYFTETELSAAGIINTASNPLDCTKLKGVPTDFADGVDNGGGSVTSVASGTGLTGGPITTTGTLNVDPGVSAGGLVFADALCPAGKKVLGGGGLALGTNSAFFDMLASFPPSTATPTKWRALFRNRDSVSREVEIRAIGMCAVVD